MKISAAFPSKYIKAADLGDAQAKVVIARVELEEIQAGEDHKPVLYFVGKKKGMVLNKTNSKTIASSYGDDTDEWSNRPLVLFSALVDFRGDQVEAIRVRVPKATVTAATVPAAQAAPTHSEINPPPASDMDDEIPF